MYIKLNPELRTNKEYSLHKNAVKANSPLPNRKNSDDNIFREQTS